MDGIIKTIAIPVQNRGDAPLISPLNTLFELNRLPDLPWKNWIEVEDSHPALGKSPDRISVENWDDPESITVDTSQTQEELESLIKAEVSKRINAVLKDIVTQINMTAYGTSLTRLEASGQITNEQLVTLNILNSAQAWVLVIKNKGRELIEAQDTTYKSDSHWIDPPPGVREVVQLL